MRLKEFKIESGFFKKTFDFSNQTNLIFSKKNSVGKTTLLRAMLYALGFNIPNTKNFKFENCHFQMHIATDSEKVLLIKRSDNYCHIINIQDNTEQTFSLPAYTNELHSIIFENNNEDILNNILAPMYVDQEKGWTLLNRGIVIGAIRFNIDKFIQGVDGIDCSSLYEELVYIETQIKNIEACYQ